MDTTLQVVTLDPPGEADAAVVWLHGLGADGHDFEPIVPELALPADHGVRFLFPHAPVRPITINGGMQMRGWYDIGGTGLDRDVDEAGIRDACARVRLLLEGEIANGIPAARIVLAGFSQGGVIAFHLGLRFPQRLAGILALSTYLPLREAFAREASDAQSTTPIFVAHGVYDPLVPVTHGNDTVTFLQGAGYTVEYTTYPMQHAVCLEEINAIGAWLRRVLSL